MKIYSKMSMKGVTKGPVEAGQKLPGSQQKRIEQFVQKDDTQNLEIPYSSHQPSSPSSAAEGPSPVGVVNDSSVADGGSRMRCLRMSEREIIPKIGIDNTKIVLRGFELFALKRKFKKDKQSRNTIGGLK